jgi:hypothetical protein
MSEIVPGRMLGRLPTDPAQRAANLKLARYFPAKLPSPPPLPIDASEGVGTWPMYLNDRLGDCACAAPAHMEEVFSKAVGSPRMLSDDDVLALYELQGYVPGNPATDQGSSMGNVLLNWRQGDWKASQIYAFCEIDVQNEQHLQLGLWLFRGLYIGVAMPITAQGQSVWDVVPDMPGRNEPGSWGGHAINIVSINADGSREFISWGQRMKMTKAFWDFYVDEAYCVVTHDLRAADSVLADNGFNLEQLEADMAELG